MEIDAISGAATVALTSTVIFLFIAKTWNLISSRTAMTQSFAAQVTHEAAQRFRNEFDRLSRSLSTYLSGALVFATLFVTAYQLQAKELFAGYPAWQLYLQLVFLLLVAAFATFYVMKIIRRKRRIRLLRDANIAIGQQLQNLPLGDARVYHDVATGAGIIDHVIAGQRGIVAVSVVGHRTAKKGSASLQRNEVRFTRDGTEHSTLSIVDLTTQATRLRKELTEAAGAVLRVRSVIAVPGWDVTEQLNDNHLLVNERTISMIRGWQTSDDMLLLEDANLVQEELARRCSR